MVTAITTVEPIPLVRERLCIQRVILSLLRVSHGAYLPHHNFAPDADEILMVSAIFIGQAERRPFSASKLSAYLDIPRPTLLRRLAALTREGVVAREGNYYCLRIERLASAETQRAVRRQISIITDAAKRLSRMDT